MNPAHAPKTSTVSVGIVGSGWVARMRHLPAFARNKHVLLLGIYSSNMDQAKKLAEQYPGLLVCESMEALLALPIDAVVICTPPKTHAPLAKAALLAGKHVLSEKPMTVTEEDSRELIALAKEKDRILCPAHNFMYARAMTKAQALIRSGATGAVKSVHGIQWSSWQRELPEWYSDLPRGLFFDEGPHLAYLTQAFLGPCAIRNVTYTTTGKGKSLYDQYEIDLVGTKGAGHITALYGTPTSEWFVIVACAEQTLVLDIFKDMCIVLPKEGDRTPSYLMKSVFRAEVQIWKGFLAWIRYRLFTGSHLFGADVVANRFIDAIMHGTPPPLTPEDGLQTVAFLNEVVRKSHE